MKNKYKILMTNKFKKDLKIVRKRDYYDEDLLDEVIHKLANDIPLPPNFKNHLLEPKSRRIMGVPYKAKLATRI